MTVASYKFEARNPALNLNRYYEIDLKRDLFGDWVIMTSATRGYLEEVFDVNIT